MAKQKKPVHKVQMTEGKRDIIRMLLQEYEIESAQDIQDALKDIFGPMFEALLQGEMKDHKASKAELEKLKQAWSAYPGALDVWERNFAHVEQLYDYGSAVRQIMYTTNAVESIHSSFRKVTKQGAFPNENALLKVLYLRITELYRKWEGGHVQNWAMVRNQLDMDPKIRPRIRKYEGA